MIRHYILDADNRPRPASLTEWAEWFGGNFEKRRVAQTETRLFWVSTVFLGLDHRFSGDGPPILFETMVFERERQIVKLFGKLRSFREEMECLRYSSWDDAEAGHNATVKRMLKKEADALAQFASAKERHRP
jgi:hypothetical protein